jgi:multimeric flavodoxin WrbA
MHIIAFNGSPRKKGNTSTLIDAVLEGAKSAGAETTHVHLHDLNMKGCQACYACKENHGVCALKDDLSPYLHQIKDSAGVVFGCPIYMYRISGQMKIFVDRMYSYYMPKASGERGYDSAIPPGKTFAQVTSQGAPDPEQYHRSIRYLAGMAGYGMEEAGRIVHTGGTMGEAKDSPELLNQAREIGKKMVAMYRKK